MFYSIDPLSEKLWGKMTILGEEVYALNKHLAGKDGITYNMQYANIVKKRSRIILEERNGRNSVVSNECYWIFPDPTNDKKKFYFKFENKFR